MTKSQLVEGAMVPPFQQLDSSPLRPLAGVELPFAHGSKSKSFGPSEHPIQIPAKIGSKMGGEFTFPKMVPLVLTHSHLQSLTNMEVPPRLFLASKLRICCGVREVVILLRSRVSGPSPDKSCPTVG